MVVHGTLAAVGYYTIPFNPPAPLAANERFSVVVQLTTPGEINKAFERLAERQRPIIPSVPVNQFA